MRLHDPETERAILRLAATGRKGRTMEPADGGNNLSSFFLRKLGLLYLAHIIAGMLGAYDETLRSAHWQSLIICILLIWHVQIAIGGLLDQLTRDGRHAVLPNLPIRGEHAFRWARQQFFIDRSITLACLNSLFAFALHDFTFAAPWKLAATCLLISAMSIASVQVLQQPWLERLHFLRNWSICSLLLSGWMILLVFTNKKIFRVGHTPEWLEDAIRLFTWLLPPSWVFPGRFEDGGAILALVWIIYGFVLWKQWPVVAAPFLDSPRDFDGGFGGFDEDEDQENREAPNNDIDSDHSPGERLPIRGLPPPMAIARDGWVERWVMWWIPDRDKAVAGAFCEQRPGWTKRANWMLRFLPLWLAAIWVFIHFCPESFAWKATITIWICVISTVLPLFGLLPFSNAISRAYSVCSSSGQILTFFSALPVSTRALLRVSMRITIARSIVFAVIGIPYACLFQSILDPDAPLIVSIWLVSAFCCSWITARPMLVAYRLWKTNRLKHGGGLLVGHGLLAIIGSALVIAAPLSAIFGIGFGFAGISCALENQDSGLYALGALGGLALSGLCSRAVFEIYHWHLKRRCFDWISSV